jgi:Mg-chelatase subunit ChlD
MDSNDKLVNAKRALKDNAEQLLQCGGDEYKVGIVSFASSSEVVCRPTADMGEISRKVESLRTSGTTAMDDGIREAATLVMAAPAGTDRDVVLLTDGMPDTKRRNNTKKEAEKVKKNGVTLSALAIGNQGVDMNYLKSLTPLQLQVSATEIASGLTSILRRAAQTRGLTDA